MRFVIGLGLAIVLAILVAKPAMRFIVGLALAVVLAALVWTSATGRAIQPPTVPKFGVVATTTLPPQSGEYVPAPAGAAGEPQPTPTITGR
jgi:hypothetical protein